jgi:hypothetical protein
MAETTITRPAPFIEAGGEVLVDQLTKQLGTPIDTRSYQPTVAGETALQQQARTLAGGLGSFEPFLNQAGMEATVASTLTGPNAYQDFMSPYQQEVIDTSLAALERERAAQRSAIGDQAFQFGAFGGGRQGAQEGAFDANTAFNKAQLESQLRAQGFQQSQQAAQQAFANQQALSTQQQGLAQLAPQLAQQQISGIGQLGQQQQAQAQAIIDAQASADREAAFADQQNLGFVGQQLTGLIGGYPAQAGYSTTSTPPPSPLSQILGMGAGLAGIGGQLGLFG